MTVTDPTILLVGVSPVVAEPVRKSLETLGFSKNFLQVRDGIAAVGAIRREPVDVIIIDIGDNSVDPLITIRRALHADPNAEILMVSTLTFANVKRGMEGLIQGAAQYMQTPAAHTRDQSISAFNAELKRCMEALTDARREKPRVDAPKHAPPSAQLLDVSKIELRPFSTVRPACIAVASSTGGPQALVSFFGALPNDIPQPVFLTQHMPAGFTKALADHIRKRTGWSCAEALNGVHVNPGMIHVAPGDYHMTVSGAPGNARVRLNQTPPENFCRPSAEPMLRSLITVYGARNILLVVLTGMGQDGVNAAQELVGGGGVVIAQDQESSTVWGMPRAVAVKGLCSAVLPLRELAPKVKDLIGR